MNALRVKPPVIVNYAGNTMILPEPRKTVIVDLDGTLCNNRHRQHYMDGPKKNWKDFFEAMTHDLVVQEVKWFIKLVFECTDYAVVLSTGRPSQYQELTSEWLARNGIPFTILMMRAEGDGTSDSTCKKNMLKVLRSMGYEPILSIDDRPEVVQMWRDNGVPVWQPDATDWYKQQTPEMPLLQALEQLRYNAVMMPQSHEGNMVRQYASVITTHVDSLTHEIRQLRDELERLRA